jgi:hypothetical protein
MSDHAPDDAPRPESSATPSPDDGRARLAGALGAVWGVTEPEEDEDGDFPFWVGSAYGWVHPLVGPDPAAQVTLVLLAGLVEDDALAAAVDTYMSSMPGTVSLGVADGTLAAVRQLAAEECDDVALRAVFDELTALAHWVSVVWGAQFGGVGPGDAPDDSVISTLPPVTG